MWIGTAGLIKVVPSIAHDLTTSGVDHYIDRQCIRMGVADAEPEEFMKMQSFGPWGIKREPHLRSLTGPTLNSLPAAPASRS